MRFMPFDTVVYSGEKHRAEIKDKLGEVVATVGGQPGMYVVEFGDSSYIMSENVFRRYTPSAKDEAKGGPVVHVRRRRASEDEV